jgi:hypothetical protein
MLWLLAANALADPIVSDARGLRDVPFSVTLTAGNGGTLHYALDGGVPDRLYTGPIEVDRTMTLRATETFADGTVSPIVTHTWVFVDQVLTSAVMLPGIAQDPVTGPIVASSLRSLPTVAVTLPSALSTVEQAGSVEWIDPAGDDAQVDCGVHIVGGTSWVYPKASVRLNFRAEYGASKWEFDVFGDDASGVRPTDAFDALTLRSGNHDTVFWLGERGQQLRNLWFDETQLAMGHIMPHGRFAHVYVNGQYHGLFHVRERFGAGFMESYFGGDESDYETMTGSVVEDGSGLGWASVTAAAGDFETVARWIDVPQYLDYMVLNYYAGNAWDWWSFHNWMTSGPSVPDVRGGFVFHGNDNDITLDYEWDVNILHLGGPSDLFPTLMAERHPDFLVALEDAIHRNFESNGPLTAQNAGDRYDRLAGLADDAIWAESARWNQGWWDHDGEWVPERDSLLNVWFPRRTDEILRQFRAAGWYPFDAPTFDQAPGVVAAGTRLTVEAPRDPPGELWVTTDGRDPRLPGGATAPTATLAAGDTFEVVIDRSTVVSARKKFGPEWGPLETAFFEVDGPAPVLLNEWNAVDDDEVLSDGDPALGQLAGNGGDWIELVVTEDTDLRGWRITMRDRLGPAGELTFTDDPLLANLAAGTLITIAEDLPEDAAYDPAGGDWRFHLRAADGATGTYITAADFDVTPLDWQLTLWDAAGNIRFGPVGEAVSPDAGISGSEVGQLAGHAVSAVRRDNAAYEDSDGSTYGAPNAWDGGTQDLGWVPEGTPPTTEPDPDPDPDLPADPAAPAADGSTAAEVGCATAPAGGLACVLLAVLAACARGTPSSPRDGSTPPATATTPTEPAPSARDGDGDGASDAEDCDDGDPTVYPGAPERCDAVDNDCDAQTDEDPVDGLPFYRDEDGDGFGTDGIVTACRLAEGLALATGDCDDADPLRHPDAPELCDAIDQDCDGVEDSAGISEACAVASCAAVGGPAGTYWVLLPGGATEVYCDGDGFLLGFLRNTASTGSHVGFGAGEVSPEVLAGSPEAASASRVPAIGWHDLAGLDWDTLRLASYANGGLTYLSRDIPRTDLRISFGQDGYYLYGESGYYWCGGRASYTDGGVGAVNNPPGAPADCKGHGSLGSGWDFSETTGYNTGLTLCGTDGSSFLHASWGGTAISYGSTGGAQAIWVR